MRLQLLGALSMVGGLLATAATATTLVPLGLDEMAIQAPVAILGEVAAAPESVSGDGSYRLATFTVTEALWGTSEAKLNVVIPGGTQRVGKLNVVQVVPGAPQLLSGGRLLLLLQPSASGDGFQVVGFNQGAFNVSVDGQVLLPGETAPMPVAQAMEKIRELRAQGPTPAAPQVPQLR